MGRNEKFSLIDAFFFSIMVGIGETYIPAFALHNGMSEVLAGYLATFPVMAGAALQLITPYLINHIKNHRRYVLICAFFQAMSFIVLMVADFSSAQGWWKLFVISSLYWAFGFSSWPVWNSWMTKLIPSKDAPRFFSIRLRLTQMGVLLGLVGGGWLLNDHKNILFFSSMFSWLFLIAWISRIISWWSLTQQQSVSYESHRLSIFGTVKNFFKSRGQMDFFGFLFFIYIAIFISSPFVTPYLLKKLNFSYFEYTLALASLFIAKILVLPLAKIGLETVGAKKIFFLGLLGLAPLPALWPVCDSLAEIIILQAVSGSFWCCFEVSLSVIFFNQIKPNEKIRLLTVYNFFNSSAIIIGSAIGGLWLHQSFESIHAYYEVFVGGAAIRALVVVLFFFWTLKQTEFSVSDVDDPTNPGDPFQKRLRVT